MTCSPEAIAGRLYQEYLVTRLALDYVTNAVGVTNDSKAHRLAQGIEESIIGDVDPEGMLMRMLDILRDAVPSGSTVAERIEQVSMWYSSLLRETLYQSSVIG